MANKALILALAILLPCGFVLAEGENAHGSGSAALDSFTIIVREGLEAILILASIIAYLAATKNADKIRQVYVWAGTAVAASVVTAIVLDSVLAASQALQQAIEGVTLLIAAGVLLYVTNWFLGMANSRKWKEYIKGKVGDALATGSGITLGVTSFLAVYREGFETVLFLKAVAFTSNDYSGLAIGVLGAAVVLATAFVLILKLERRLPLGTVFAVTSALLFILAFKFAGTGVHELQEAGMVAETAFGAVPQIHELGTYSTLETSAIQLAIIAGGGLLFWLHLRESPKKSAPA